MPDDTQEERPIEGNAPPGVDATDLYRSGQDLDLSLSIEAGGPIRAIDAGVHVIDGSIDGNRATLKLRKTAEIPNEDFVLSFKAGGEHITPAVLSHRDTRGGFFTVLVQPALDALPEDAAPREIILVIDVSGSMSAMHAITQYVARHILKSARPYDRINLVSFAGAQKTWAAEPRIANRENVDSAIAFVDRLQAGGGTRFVRGVRALYGLPPADGLTRHVFVLTDGAIGNDDSVVGAFRATEGESRIFPIGIASAPNASLLERIAHKGHGFTTYLYTMDDAVDRIQTLLHRTRSPVLTNVSIDWGELPVSRVVPEVIPDVFLGLPLLVSGRYQQAAEGQVIVRGTQGGRDVALPVAVQLTGEDERPAVPYLWARRRISELTAAEDMFGDEVRDEITKLGLSFSLVTAFTAFIAVDTGVQDSDDLDGQQDRPESAPFAGQYAGADGVASCAVGHGHGGPNILWALGLMGLMLRRRRSR